MLKKALTKQATIEKSESIVFDDDSQYALLRTHLKRARFGRARIGTSGVHDEQ